MAPILFGSRSISVGLLEPGFSGGIGGWLWLGGRVGGRVSGRVGGLVGGLTHSDNRASLSSSVAEVLLSNWN